MKKQLLSLLVLSATSTFTVSAQNSGAFAGNFSVNIKSHEESDISDRNPMFPGPGPSLQNVADYFATGIKYPADAQKKKLTGTVSVSFTIDEQGRVQNPVVTTHLYPSMDKEALRLVKSMPKWEPAMKDGQIVSAKWSADIAFNL